MDRRRNTRNFNCVTNQRLNEYAHEYSPRINCSGKSQIMYLVRRIFKLAPTHKSLQMIWQTINDCQLYYLDFFVEDLHDDFRIVTANYFKMSSGLLRHRESLMPKSLSALEGSL